MKKQSPAFQFYADDFLGGTIDLTTEEVGAYIRLLCFQWNRGSIPAHQDKVNLIAGCAVSPSVMSKFPDGKNERLENERVKQSEFRELQSQRGKAGAERRWHSGGHSGGHSASIAQALLTPQPDYSSPSPSPNIEIIKGDFPETPPMSRAKFDELCQLRGVPADCANWFWNANDSANWLDKYKRPIRKVEPLLMNALATWRQNQAKAAKPEPRRKSFQEWKEESDEAIRTKRILKEIENA